MLSQSNKLSRWNIYPTDEDIFSIFFPSSNISPSLGGNSPAISDKIVVFPQPDGPTMLTNSFLLTSKLKSFRASVSFAFDWYTSFISFSSRILSMAILLMAIYQKSMLMNCLRLCQKLCVCLLCQRSSKHRVICYKTIHSLLVCSSMHRLIYKNR